jgi:hypothetical protein
MPAREKSTMTDRVDLHTHSRHSDGTLSPVELLEMAAGNGFRAIALADHDAVSGIGEALEAGNRLGVEVIPAVELSVELRGNEDVHLLGFFIDHTDPRFLEKLALFCKRRDRRGEEILAKINERLAETGKRGIGYEEVTVDADGALGRPHIARVLVAKGYAASMENAFDEFLVPCNVPKEYFAADEAISEIHRIGGLAVLAHPTSITRDRTMLRELIAELIRHGLDGLEAMNNMASIDETDFLLGIARRHGLLVTGGSDFHGNSDEELGIDDGRHPVDYRLVEALKERLAARG